MHIRSFFVFLLLFLCLLVLHFQCANPVTPEGGAKDIKPPEVIGAEPPNYSTQFVSPSIRIYFNEFISLKSTGNEIFVSPPLAKKPDYKLRGKSVLINLKDSLTPNTTYNINFGRAISPITEGNILTDFNYVFSTGTFIDSLMISGSVINAFDDEPVPDVYAELYTNSVDAIPFDSLPYLVPPLYLARTDKQGRFSFHNLRNESYKLIVLDDQSGDMIYNMPAEKIAFADSLVKPWLDPGVRPDSTGSDTVPVSDSIAHKMLILRLFEEVDSSQEVARSELLKNGLIRIIYKFPPRHPRITPLNIDTTVAWCTEEYSTNRDTVLLFTQVDLPDTLILQIHDSPEILDTVTIFPTRLPPPKRGKNEAEKPEQLSVTWDSRGNFNHLKSKLTCTFSYPVTKFDFRGILLISGGDTLIPKVSFADTLMRKIVVEATWKEATSYRLLIPDSAFITSNGLSHDTIRHTFQTVNTRDLGSLFINLNIADQPGSYIVQLLTEKGKVVEEQMISESGTVKFPFIAPAKYRIKAILDSNLNKRWDTGYYLLKKQPELVFFFPKTIEIRGNWDVEEEWNL
ncbi:MAG: hypothetical protein D4R67_12645 [Bacteroidetes bacterium]|nr:MAG: hypothetical protein D4R67_12645 [Bacteroidota bacterium]